MHDTNRLNGRGTCEFLLLFHLHHFPHCCFNSSYVVYVLSTTDDDGETRQQNPAKRNQLNKPDYTEPAPKAAPKIIMNQLYFPLPVFLPPLGSIKPRCWTKEPTINGSLSSLARLCSYIASPGAPKFEPPSQTRRTQ